LFSFIISRYKPVTAKTPSYRVPHLNFEKKKPTKHAARVEFKAILAAATSGFFF
jgi:hypothetical protein